MALLIEPGEAFCIRSHHSSLAKKEEMFEAFQGSGKGCR